MISACKLMHAFQIGVRRNVKLNLNEQNLSFTVSVSRGITLATNEYVLYFSVFPNQEMHIIMWLVHNVKQVTLTF